MVDWAQGYVADLEYSGMFYAAQAPIHLNLACVVAGFEPIPLDGDFTYCELGCGQGVTANLLAAANPKGSFYAVDFNPSHIARARDFARSAGLDNVTFEERSFAELAAAPPAQLPQFDFVTLHGIYSWVSRENQQAIVEFLRNRVKPGGIVYVSYNSLPGWSAGAPVQRLLHDVAALGGGRSDHRLQRALGIVEEIGKADFQHLAGNEFLARIRELAGQNATRYLVHEYLNANWQPLYFADVARDFEAAKLSFAASADLFENYPELMLTAEQRNAMAPFGGTVLWETLKDFALKRPFRKDIFIRGARPLGNARRDRLIRGLTFAASVPRENVRLVIEVPAGEATMQARTYEPVFDALAERPHTIAELLDLPALAGHSTITPVELAGMLAASGQALPATGGDREAARRFNRRLAESLSSDEPTRRYALAAPRLATGIAVNVFQLLVFGALAAGCSRPEAVVDHVRSALAARGETLTRDGKPMESEQESRIALNENVATSMREMIPLWRALEIV